MNDKIVVQVENLTKRFGTFTAVNNVSLSVRQGEIFGFLGANGAGKTTVIRMLCGLLLPSSGMGKVAGYDILTQPERIKRAIGYMSQKFSLYPDMTGRENLYFYGAAYGLGRKLIGERVMALSERLSLREFLDRPSKGLPIGWRQRLALAVSTLHHPKILFLDEPTGGVDPAFRRTFWSTLYDLAEEGATIFVTTHYMDEAEYCRRISIMHQGQIIELGTPHELVKKHRAANLEDMFVDLIRKRESDNA